MARLRDAVPLAVLFGCLSACSGAHAEHNGYASLVRQVAPSVVTILVEQNREGAGQRAVERATGFEYNDMRSVMRRLLSGPPSAPEPRDGQSILGSGFIIRADGLIVTNRHVIAAARTIQVKLFDGRQVPAKLIGADVTTDIALLKVNVGSLRPVHLGTSANISVGETVIAIGDPYGIGQTVTAGIISARGRTLEIDPYIDFLQTDAAINSGNSGGPLLSTDGTVVGVTSAIFSVSGGSMGLGFAIPAETAATVIEELESHGKVERGYLGTRCSP